MWSFLGCIRLSPHFRCFFLLLHPEVNVTLGNATFPCVEMRKQISSYTRLLWRPLSRPTWTWILTESASSPSGYLCQRYYFFLWKGSGAFGPLAPWSQSDHGKETSTVACSYGVNVNGTLNISVLVICSDSSNCYVICCESNETSRVYNWGGGGRRERTGESD